MGLEIVPSSQVSAADQVELVNTYVTLRAAGNDVSGILNLVTDDMHYESPVATLQGKSKLSVTTAACMFETCNGRDMQSGTPSITEKVETRVPWQHQHTNSQLTPYSLDNFIDIGAFEEFLQAKKPGSVSNSTAKIVDGVCQVDMTSKVGFKKVKLVAKFGIVSTEGGPKIEKILVKRA